MSVVFEPGCMVLLPSGRTGIIRRPSDWKRLSKYEIRAHDRFEVQYTDNKDLVSIKSSLLRLLSRPAKERA